MATVGILGHDIKCSATSNRVDALSIVDQMAETRGGKGTHQEHSRHVWLKTPGSAALIEYVEGLDNLPARAQRTTEDGVMVHSILAIELIQRAFAPPEELFIDPWVCRVLETFREGISCAPFGWKEMFIGRFHHLTNDKHIVYSVAPELIARIKLWSFDLWEDRGDAMDAMNHVLRWTINYSNIIRPYTMAIEAAKIKTLNVIGGSKNE
ncbi:MAG: hypothetical protein DRJ03_07385 [Chloroflexi bacterium]|nr:MAG: hypothetical protein DRJ03_07385 [Chloroflexota bacterium]